MWFQNSQYHLQAAENTPKKRQHLFVLEKTCQQNYLDLHALSSKPHLWDHLQLHVMDDLESPII